MIEINVVPYTIYANSFFITVALVTLLCHNYSGVICRLKNIACVCMRVLVILFSSNFINYVHKTRPIKTSNLFAKRPIELKWTIHCNAIIMIIK